MSEETDAPQGGAEDFNTLPQFVEQVASEAVETISEATTEQPTGTDEPGPADDAGEATEEPVKRVPWFQKRIDEVTARKYEAEREAAYWRGIAEGGPRQQPAEQQVEPPEPFDPGYNDWVIEQAAQRVAQRQQRQSLLQSYEQREAQARSAHADFDSVVRDPSLPISPVMAEVIRESDLGPEVAYHLGTNRQEASRIASLSPARQAAELGRIEALLARPTSPTTKPIPPAPPQTVGGVSSGLQKTMEQMSYTEFVKMREAEEKNRN